MREKRSNHLSILILEDVRSDELGSTISLSTYFPEEGSQQAEVTLKVPKGANSGTLHS